MTGSLAPAEHVDARELDRSIALNFRATQRLIRVLDPLLRRAPAGRAVFFRDEQAEGQPFHATYTAAKTAQLDMVRAWGRGLEQASPARVTVWSPPAMRTALRARFHPGGWPCCGLRPFLRMSRRVRMRVVRNEWQ